MIVRDATEADIDSCNEVWASTQADLGNGPIPYQPLSMHELQTGRLTVAEVDGQVVGFGGTVTRSGVLYLVDLFVSPAHQSHGIGRRLMHVLCADHAGPSFTFASSDPRAQRLYEQFGMHAVEQYHYLDARVDTLAPWATDVELVRAQRADIVAIDMVATGRDRTVDIDYATTLGSSWYLGHRNGARVGAVALTAPTWWSPWHPSGARLGPVMAGDAADVAPILAAALVAVLSLVPRPDFVSTFAPSSLDSLPALRSAVFEVIDTDLLMASDPGLIDRHRYLPTVDTP
ncbi:MAG: GNAT family N-acetyltransferase [Ilumatobacteraceae bacterium]